MSKLTKIMSKLLSGSSDSNIDFKSICSLLYSLGFEGRIKGDHHIFTKHNIEEIINIQPIKSKAKSYQVKQIRNLIVKYKMGERNVK